MATTTKTPAELLREAVSKPKSVSADGESVSQFQLTELLEAAASIPKTAKPIGSRIRCMRATGNSAV